MSSSDFQARFGQTLVDFSSKGIFPEEEAISSATIEASALPAALGALDAAKADLEKEIREISRQSAPDVDSWIANAKSLQDDIETSRRLAGDIVQQATAEETREETIREKAIYQDFLVKETSFNSALLEALRLIQSVNNCLDKAEQLIEDRRILDALDMLADASKFLDEVPVEKNTRAIRLLDQRASELKAATHDQLMILWGQLISVDFQNQEVTINQMLPSGPGNLNDAITGLKYYDELDSAAQKLWQALDKIIFAPRTDLFLPVLPSIKISKISIALGQEPIEPTIKSLFHDLEGTIRFLDTSLPEEVVAPLSEAMMPSLSTRIKEVWLDTAVPSSLDSMREYQKALAQVHEFAEVLKLLKWPGVDSFNDWVSNVPKIWLAKKREDALDWVRNSLSLGIGSSQPAQRIETRMVERDEDTLANTDWDAAWKSDDDELPTDNDDNGTEVRNRHSIEEDRKNKEVDTPDDEAADAWGWGDDDIVEESEPPDTEEKSTLLTPQHMTPKMREKTITEKYWTSSLPQPILKTVDQIYNDGATLLKPENEHLPVAPAAAALFVLPTLILAMYRSVGPIYYGLHASGNMFLYNDTLWLADELRNFATAWKSRDDIPPRAIALVRLDSEFTILESFGKRAYANELNSQRTIINDLLGGTQNFFQDESSDIEELRIRINNVIDHIHSKGSDWEQILSHSAWSSSIGALVNAVATRLINDVFDMQSMSVVEAENAAIVISLVEKLDTLFLPKQRNGDHNGLFDNDEPIPLTASFADKWMKMKYLCQILQSNLAEIQYLWAESELSLFFTAQEVVDLIQLSFENNPQVRTQIRKIRDNPHPRGE